MSTLENRSGSALIVIDVQKGVFADAFDRDGVIARIQDLVAQARNEGTPVVWVQHSDDELVYGSEGWEIVDELTPNEGEARIEKNYGDSFEATGLEESLANLGVAELIVTGGQTDFCVRSTLHGALTRGYDVTLVGDAHSTIDLSEWIDGVPQPEAIIAHTNAYWNNQSAPGRIAQTIAANDVTFDAGRAE